MVAADIVGGFLRVFQIDRVFFHADRKRANRFFEQSLRHGAHERRIQSARKKKAQRRIGVEPLFDPRNQLFANIFAENVGLRLFDARYVRDIAVPHERAVFIIMTGRKGKHFFRDRNKVFGFACKRDFSVRHVSVIQRSDAYGIARGKIDLFLRVVNHAGKFRVEHGEHSCTVFFI